MIDLDVVLGTCMDVSTSDEELIIVFTKDECDVAVDSWKTGVVVGYSDDINGDVYRAWLDCVSRDMVRIWNCLEDSAGVG